MRIVSENSEAEIARHEAMRKADRAKQKVDLALRQLTANLLLFGSTTDCIRYA
jgi:hypothetical protein